MLCSSVALEKGPSKALNMQPCLRDQTAGLGVLSFPFEVPRVLFLGICLDFYYFLRRVLLPKIGFHFDWGSVSQALVKPHLVPP